MVIKHNTTGAAGQQCLSSICSSRASPSGGMLSLQTVVYFLLLAQLYLDKLRTTSRAVKKKKGIYELIENIMWVQFLDTELHLNAVRPKSRSSGEQEWQM